MVIGVGVDGFDMVLFDVKGFFNNVDDWCNGIGSIGSCIKNLFVFVFFRSIYVVNDIWNIFFIWSGE